MITLLMMLTKGLSMPFVINRSASKKKKDRTTSLWCTTPTLTAENKNSLLENGLKNRNNLSEVDMIIPGHCRDPRSPCKCKTRIEYVSDIKVTHHICDTKKNRDRVFPPNLQCKQITEQMFTPSDHIRNTGCELRCIDKCKS